MEEHLIGQAERRALDQRHRLYELYNDPNWMLQAGLGDIEFEQDMYDDFMYGKPALDEMGVNQRGLDLLSSFPDDPYDKLAMEGLRQHSKEGIYRYLDRSPYDVGSLETVDPGQEEGYKGQYNEWSIPEERKQYPTFMDFNMNALLRDWNKEKMWWRGKQGNLQDQISDNARHEYKHAFLNKREANNYYHPAIYGSGAIYNLDPQSSKESFHRFAEPQKTYERGNVDSPWIKETYSPHRAGELAQETVQKFARPPKGAAGFNTGGIASLENEEEGWDNLKDIIPWLYPDDIPWDWYLNPTEEEIDV